MRIHQSPDASPRLSCDTKKVQFPALERKPGEKCCICEQARSSATKCVGRAQKHACARCPHEAPLSAPRSALYRKGLERAPLFLVLFHPGADDTDTSCPPAKSDMCRPSGVARRCSYPGLGTATMIDPLAHLGPGAVHHGCMLHEGAGLERDWHFVSGVTLRAQGCLEPNSRAHDGSSLTVSRLWP